MAAITTTTLRGNNPSFSPSSSGAPSPTFASGDGGGKRGTPKQSPFSKFKQMEIELANIGQDSPKHSNATGRLFRQGSMPSATSWRQPPSPGLATRPAAAAAPVVRSATSAKDTILVWAQQQVNHYKNVNVTNFSTSWNDGLAFCALIHNFYPEAFDFEKLEPHDRRHNFTLAFDAAEEYGGVCPLLDVDDMVAMTKPDWKCVFTYVQSFYRRFRNGREPPSPTKTLILDRFPDEQQQQRPSSVRPTAAKKHEYILTSDKVIEPFERFKNFEIKPLPKTTFSSGATNSSRQTAMPVKPSSHTQPQKSLNNHYHSSFLTQGKTWQSSNNAYQRQPSEPVRHNPIPIAFNRQTSLPATDNFAPPLPRSNISFNHSFSLAEVLGHHQQEEAIRDNACHLNNDVMPSTNRTNIFPQCKQLTNVGYITELQKSESEALILNNPFPSLTRELSPASVLKKTIYQDRVDICSTPTSEHFSALPPLPRSISNSSVNKRQLSRNSSLERKEFEPALPSTPLWFRATPTPPPPPPQSSDLAPFELNNEDLVNVESSRRGTPKPSSTSRPTTPRVATPLISQGNPIQSEQILVERSPSATRFTPYQPYPGLSPLPATIFPDKDPVQSLEIDWNSSSANGLEFPFPHVVEVIEFHLEPVCYKNKGAIKVSRCTQTEPSPVSCDVSAGTLINGRGSSPPRPQTAPLLDYNFHIDEQFGGSSEAAAVWAAILRYKRHQSMPPVSSQSGGLVSQVPWTRKC